MKIFLSFVLVLLTSLCIGFGGYFLTILLLGSIEAKQYPATFIGATLGLLSFDWLFKIRMVKKIMEGEENDKES